MANVCVIGGGGGIGQPCSMFLKMNPRVGHLRVFDMVGAPGVAADLSHIDTPAKVTGHGMTLAQMKGEDAAVAVKDKDAYQAAAMQEALTGCDIVVIPAGVPRKPGMTRQDLFEVNAGLVVGFADAITKYCPKAFVCIITNPVNSTVPIFAEQMKKLGSYDPKRIFGVTSLDLVRARTFVAEAAGIDVNDITIPVVGGHAGKSILPLLSQAQPPVLNKLTQAQVEALTDRIQNGGTEVVNAKAGAGSATLSMAKAGAYFADSLIRAMHGEAGIQEYTFVANDITSCEFFATKVDLGPNGVEAIHGLGDMSDYEKGLLKAAIAELQPSITEGIEYITKAKL